ncbi:LacI family DNA-binding transcriptional regulator [Rhodanobacter aciditrophus]|uniref:LacI family DNA-binding transcriptional regulator n=1 Tax=Rhodanobacter aciditrophus TaxID=1623218 RepID=A0ABW4AZ15_9GAMM
MSIKDIATQLDLSVSTVSRALNDYPDISPRTKKRVWKAAQALGYKLKRDDNTQWTQTKKSVCVLLPSHESQLIDPILSKVLAGTRQHLQQHGYLLQVIALDQGREELSQLERLIRSGDQDAFLLLRTRVNDPKVHRLLKLNVPFVCYGRMELAQHFAWLDLDNYHMGRMAIAKLAELGHHKVAILAPDKRYFFVQERLRGIAEEAAAQGLVLSSDYWIEMDFDEEACYLACVERLLQYPEITAVLALTSVGANSAGMAALRVGDQHRQVAILGCDTPLDEQRASLGIIGLQQAPPHLIGERLADMVLARIQGTPVKDLQVELSPGVVTSG